MDTNPNIAVDRVNLVDLGNIKAFAKATVKTPVGPIQLDGLKVIQVEGKDAFVSSPQKKGKGKNANKYFDDQYHCSPELKSVLSVAVLNAYKAAIAAKPAA